MSINEENITQYQTGNGAEHDHVELPSYYLAEWIAENWWPLLWEPQKSEGEGDDPHFNDRHLISIAGHGFALPHLTIVSTGECIHLFAAPRDAKYADARFRARVDALAERAQVESTLKEFVQATVDRLAGGAPNTPLHAAWSLVSETHDEALQFCKLMGALGLSPYEKHDNIERALDGAANMLNDDQLLDLCLTSTPENIVRSAYAAAIMQQAIEKSGSVDLSEIPRGLPDQPSLPAWKVGYSAAKTLRKELSIGESEIDGASRIFEKLRIEEAAKHEIDLKGVESPVVGGVETKKSLGRLALGGESREARRFAIARATYFFMTGRDQERRLITSAVTRDQQASRAFAAELLVPQSFLRSHSLSNKIARARIHEIATIAGVSTELVSLQASNGGLYVAH